MKTCIITLICLISAACIAAELSADDCCCGVCPPAELIVLNDHDALAITEEMPAEEIHTAYPIYVYQCFHGHIFRFPIPGNYRCRFDQTFLKLVRVE